MDRDKANPNFGTVVASINPDLAFSRETLAGYSPEMLSKTLLLVGAGALGQALALQCAMWGFRSAIVVDYDAYETSNATRTLDFPYSRTNAGERVSKANHIVDLWRQRRIDAGDDADIRAIDGYLQELEPELWRQADVVLSAVDHPRARRDLAFLARQYRKPVIMGGFDGRTTALTIEYFAVEATAACHDCIYPIPDYDIPGISCTAYGQRLLSRGKLPATPTLAAGAATFMMQILVDGLRDGFSANTSSLQVYLGVGRSSERILEGIASVKQGCMWHAQDPLFTELRPLDQTLGALLDSIERSHPGASLVPTGPIPIHALTTRTGRLVRVACPAWRATGDLESFPAVPAGAQPLVLDEVSHDTAAMLGLRDLQTLRLGLASGAVFMIRDDEGELISCAWVD